METRAFPPETPGSHIVAKTINWDAKMPISWNEIRQNAIRFAADWAGATSESAEKQTFWNEGHEFAFLAGYQQHRFKDQDPINLRAVAIMDDLHDALEAGGYEGHDLERFLVRVLFCLFAQCTGIFERAAFGLFIEDRTKPDGSDLGVHLEQLFAVLNTPADKRQRPVTRWL